MKKLTGNNQYVFLFTSKTFSLPKPEKFWIQAKKNIWLFPWIFFCVFHPKLLILEIQLPFFKYFFSRSLKVWTFKVHSLQDKSEIDMSSLFTGKQLMPNSEKWSRVMITSRSFRTFQIYLVIEWHLFHEVAESYYENFNATK